MPQDLRSVRSAREPSEDRLDFSSAVGWMDALRATWETRTLAGDQRERVDERRDEQDRPREESPPHETSPERARQAAARSVGMSAVEANARDPVSRTMGFRAASLVIGSVGNAHVTQVKAAIERPKRSTAY